MSDQEFVDMHDEWAASMMKEHGWYAHCIFPTEKDPVLDDSPTNMDLHTHGLSETYGHLDLQIVLPLKYEQGMSVLHLIANSIKEGARYEPGSITTDLIEGREGEEMPIAFAAAKENGRDVLRVVLPDPNASVDRNSMTPEYAVQWADID